MQSPAPAFSESLGSLRGLAATAVVFYHGMMIARLGGIDDPHDLPVDFTSPWLLLQHGFLAIFNGSAAVILFFVLSGTVLSLSLSRSSGLGLFELVAYYIKRMFRLVPLLVAVALAAAALHHFYFEDTDFAFATSWMNWHFKHDPQLPEVVANMIGWSHSLNSPAWTIFIEICASILFPALYVLSEQRRFRAATVVILVGIALTPLPFRGLHMFLICFFAGALIPKVGKDLAGRFYNLSRWIRIAAILLALMAMGWFQRFYAPAAFVDPVVVLINTISATFLVTVTYFSPRGRFLSWRPFLFIGEISYGLYLIHFIVLFMLAHAVAPWIIEPFTAQAAILAGLGFGVATLVLTIPIATFTYYILERPLQDAGRALARLVKQNGRIGLRPASPPQRM